MAFQANKRWAKRISSSQARAFNKEIERRAAAEAMRPKTPRNWHGRLWGADRVAFEEEQKRLYNEHAQRDGAIKMLSMQTNYTMKIQARPLTALDSHYLVVMLHLRLRLCLALNHGLSGQNAVRVFLARQKLKKHLCARRIQSLYRMHPVIRCLQS